MTFRVEVLDEAASDAPANTLRRLAEAVAEAEGVEGVLTLALVDESVIADLNLRYRGLDGPTDVLSFSDEPVDEAWSGQEPAPWGEDELKPALHEWGEVVVCPIVVRRYAAEDGVEFRRQLAWTVVHGVLHLLGYDHEVDQGQMREREQELLLRFYQEVPGSGDDQQVPGE